MGMGGGIRPFWRSMAAEDAEMQTNAGAKTKTSPDTMSSKPNQLWQRMAVEDAKTRTSPDVKTVSSIQGMWFSMAAEDANLQTTTVQDAKMQTNAGEMAANVQLISNGMTPPTNAELVNPNVFQWKFNTSTDVLEYVQSQQNRGIPVLITRPESLNRSVDILGTEDLPWDQMLMTCHLIGDITCHVPFRSQVFTMAHVRFSDTQEEDHLMFTQHKIHPLCVENCEYMHHVSEVLLMKYPLNVTQMLLV